MYSNCVMGRNEVGHRSSGIITSRRKTNTMTRLIICGQWTIVTHMGDTALH